MTEDRLPLAELLAKAGNGDFLRTVAEAVVQLLMEADVEGVIGAGRHERTADRQTYRNGFRDRTLDTRLGTLQLRIPKLRQGNYFPPFLDPRKTLEKALVAVIQEAWIGGVSTRRVDELVQAMGLGGISKSTVSKLGVKRPMISCGSGALDLGRQTKKASAFRRKMPANHDPLCPSNRQWSEPLEMVSGRRRGNDRTSQRQGALRTSSRAERR